MCPSSAPTSSAKDAHLRAIRTDNGVEYLSNELKSYHGIRHQLRVAYTPQQNGVAEHMYRTLMDLVHCMLHDRNVQKPFLFEALSICVYVRNRGTSRGLPRNITPHHIWYGEATNVENMRVFGSQCSYVLPKKQVKYLDAHACEGGSWVTPRTARATRCGTRSPEICLCRVIFASMSLIKKSLSEQIAQKKNVKSKRKSSSPVEVDDRAAKGRHGTRFLKMSSPTLTDLNRQTRVTLMLRKSPKSLNRCRFFVESNVPEGRPASFGSQTNQDAAWLSRKLPSSHHQAMNSEDADF